MANKPASVTNALERRLRNEVSIHVSLSGEDELSRDILALLADRTRDKERITELEAALPGADKLDILADLVDHWYPDDPEPEMQNDIRQWARGIRALLEEVPDAQAE